MDLQTDGQTDGRTFLPGLLGHLKVVIRQRGGRGSNPRPLKDCLMLSVAGSRVRRRRVRQYSVAGGRACPALYAVQPCHYPPCHTWVVTSRGDCQLDDSADVIGSCGLGHRNNTVACVDQRQVTQTSCSCSFGLVSEQNLQLTLKCTKLPKW